jgi:uncharacterized repeat protein (TIGR03803 family)
MKIKKRFGHGLVIGISAFICMAGAFGNPSVSLAAFSTLHSFGSVAGDGANPSGDLILYKSTLYGMTSGGGAHGYGTIFQMNMKNGSGRQVMHSFSGAGDGAGPKGSLTLSGSTTLFGMTYGGGAHGCGTIFQINTDGTGYKVLLSFSGDDGTNRGANPCGTLTLSGSKLFGMTSMGGANGCGTIFEINTDGKGYNVLYDIGNGDIDGLCPKGSLTLVGSTTLYGMAYQGGAEGYGAIFQINTDGSGYDVLYSFDTGDTGANPWGSLTFSGSALYGMTYAGGAKECGMIFKINTDGTDFRLLHSFSGSDGAGPKGSLTLLGSTLYGMTSLYGSDSAKSYGTIFQINADGSNYKVLQSFGYTNGATPEGSLTPCGLTLYGMTSAGGGKKSGTIFSLTVTAAPGAPTIGKVTPGNGQVTVNFTPPAFEGGSSIISYTATSSGGQKASGKATAKSITVKGLKNGTPYTFTVTAKNGVGTSLPSGASRRVIPVQ